VLLVGTRQANESALGQLLPFSRQPCYVDVGETLRPDTGTVVLRDVEKLDGDAQRDLLRWIDATYRRVQLITLATVPLFPFVDSGAFRPDLFYRLNAITIALV
jgi:transcriptional regulator of aromatic amino acid metabolism